MNTVLLTVGCACVVLAIVGGGGKVLGVELEPIQGRRRIAALAVAGVAFLLLAYLTREIPTPGPEPQDVKAYRTAAAQTCRSLATNKDGLGSAMNPDGTFDRARLQQLFHSQLEAARAILAGLWKRDVPHSLAADARSARAASDRLLSASAKEIDARASTLGKTVTTQELQQWGNDLSARLSGPNTALQSALSQISEQPCTFSSSGSVE